MNTEPIATVAHADPVTMALLVALGLIGVVQLLLRRNGNGKHAALPPQPKPGFTDEEAGRIKEQVRQLEADSKAFKDWRHNEYVEDRIQLQRSMVSREVLEVMAGESTKDRANLWAAIRRLEEKHR